MNASTHSADCWQWHHDCDVRRIESVLAVHTPIEQWPGVVICAHCEEGVLCPTVAAVEGQR